MLKTTQHGDVTIAEFAGRFDGLNEDLIEQVEQELAALVDRVEPPRVVCEMSGTTFFGSTFLEVLLRAWKRLRARGGQMALAGLTPFCSQVVHTARLETLWPICATRDEAVAALQDAGPASE